MAVLRITKQIVLAIRQYYHKVIFSILNKSDFDLIVGKRTGMWVDNYKVKALRKLGANIGGHTYLRSYISIIHPKNLVVGDRSKIGRGSELNLFETLTVGDDVEIGSGLIVHTAEHNMQNKNLPLCKQGAKYLPVFVSSDVYIGSRVTLLPGTFIEPRVVVGAGALAKGRLKSGFLYVGVPAKPIKRIINNTNNL